MGRTQHLGRLPHLPHLSAETVRAAFAAYIDVGAIMEHLA